VPQFLKRLSAIALFLALVFLVGTVGFHFIEGWPLFDCFYMTLITLTTVGYGEVHPLSTQVASLFQC
jgi:voltage-gated potassium channel